MTDIAAMANVIDVKNAVAITYACVLGSSLISRRAAGGRDTVWVGTGPGAILRTRVLLGRAFLSDCFESAANLFDVTAEIVQARQLREALEAEDTLEEGRRRVPDRAGFLPARFGDQAPLEQAGYDRVDRHPADARHVRTRARPEVGDHRERLEPRPGDPALDAPLQQAR